MDRSENIDLVIAYLAACFASGQRGVNRHDVIDDDGTTVQEALAAALSGRLEPPELIDALSTFSDAWSQGFDLASGDDRLADGETVADIIVAFRSSRPVTGAHPSP